MLLALSCSCQGCVPSCHRTSALHVPVGLQDGNAAVQKQAAAGRTATCVQGAAASTAANCVKAAAQAQPGMPHEADQQKNMSTQQAAVWTAAVWRASPYTWAKSMCVIDALG
jgi:hypothetical protein